MLSGRLKDFCPDLIWNCRGGQEDIGKWFIEEIIHHDSFIDTLKTVYVRNISCHYCVSSYGRMVCLNTLTHRQQNLMPYRNRSLGIFWTNGMFSGISMLNRKENILRKLSLRSWYISILVNTASIKSLFNISLRLTLYLYVCLRLSLSLYIYIFVCVCMCVCAHACWRSKDQLISDVLLWTTHVSASVGRLIRTYIFSVDTGCCLEDMLRANHD